MVTTKSQANREGRHKPLKVASSPNSAIVDRNELLRLQREDKGLERYWDRRDIKVKEKQEVSFEVKNSVFV